MVLPVLCILAFAICPPVLADFPNFYLEDNVVQFPSPTPTISAGWEALPGQHPWQLALRLISEQGTVLGCGGALVHEDWALTAAQCTAGRHTIVVRAGVTNLTTPQYMCEATEFYSHPMYDSDRPRDAQPNDITLIKLDYPVPITKLARPIRIQPTAFAFRDHDNDRVIASGFGRLHTDSALVETLYWVYLRLVPNEVCQQIFNTYDEVVTEASVCAGPYNSTAQSVCYGDSGGPLVLADEGEEPYLVGITSFVFGGEAGCHSGYPGVFVRAGAFHEWFTEITGIDFDTTPESVTEYTEPTSTPIIFTTEDPTTIESTILPSTTELLTTEILSTIPTTEEITTLESTTIHPTTELTTTEEIVQSTTKLTTEQSTTAQPTTEIPSTETSPTNIPTTTELASTSTEDSEEETSKESSEEEDDPELQELMKRLEVEVKVKVRLNKLKKKKRIHHSL